MTERKRLFMQIKIDEINCNSFPVLNLYIIIIAVLQIFGEAFEIFYLKMLKPIPILMMIIYLHKQSKTGNLLGRMVEIGLFFSMIGDVLLMDTGSMESFLLGTGFFFVAHLFFIFSFAQGGYNRDLCRLYKIGRILAFVIIFTLALLNIIHFYDKFTNKLVFAFYTLVLASELIVSLYRYESSSPQSFKWILAGAISFSISDNIIALMMFQKVLFFFTIPIIMATYYFAQFCFVHGIIHQINLQNAIRILSKKQ